MTKRVFVAGNCNIDMILPVGAFPTPGCDLILSEASTSLGGKGLNQAVAAARAGADVWLITAIGNDALSDWQLSEIERLGIHTEFVQRTNSSADFCSTIVEPDGRNTTLGSAAAVQGLAPSALEALDLTSQDLVLASLTCAVSFVQHLARLSAEARCPCFINFSPNPVSLDMFSLSTIAIANQREWQVMKAIEEPSPDHQVVVTRGPHGVDLYLGLEIERHFDAPTIYDVVDTTGAGDCFAGTLAGRLACGDSRDQALAEAIFAASESVRKHGTIASYPVRA